MSSLEAIHAAIRELAASVLGSTASADAWMQKGNPVLGGRSPLEAIATPEGHRAVVNELKRIEYACTDDGSEIEN